MTKKIAININLIDLGLPSGTLWADRNIGADNPGEYGDYFRFGESTPFSENSSQYSYNDINESIAGSEKDAATTILGAQFCMPTYNQFKELVKFCSRKWTQINGVNGTMFKGPNGNSIFFPASGLIDYDDGSPYYVGLYGYYWSASPCGSGYGYSLSFDSCSWYWLYNNRAYVFPIRAVNALKI